MGRPLSRAWRGAVIAAVLVVMILALTPYLWMLLTSGKGRLDILADKPGRASSSVGNGRSALEPQTDWHRFEKHKFAREMAKVLDAAAANKAFDRLILIAPPATLGDLRTELGDQTRKLVSAELAKDLTRHAEQELPQHLAEILAV
jgi:protein required for attachment to host cells